ncbi:MAG TPA: GH92 family glycosyl hydrolase [Mucilaginibacter sp.]|jgi:predicted alpha-1,2-mannosidase|nr:GH92 family glycosyl hydrolase [Mucilaginibacter sp.]
MKKPFILLIVLAITNSVLAQTKTPADYVNPFIGASTSAAAAGIYHGLGKTFPGASSPFGLVQVSPNTITGGDNGPGYSYEMPYIEGFAFTQMSGIGWYGDLGNFLVMPTTGPLQVTAGRHPQFGKGYRSRYSKDDEVAKAGYYAATLTDYKIRAEATITPHSGMLRFTFPQNGQSRIQIDLARRVAGTSVEQYVKVVDDHTIQGWMKCTPEGGGRGNGGGHANYTVYFYAQFSKPLKNYGVWSADIPEGQPRKLEAIQSAKYDSIISKAKIIPGIKEIQGKHLGFFTEFATHEGEQVLLKSGISLTSMDGARLNLLQEIPDFNFDKVHQRAKALWDRELSKVKIEGGTDDQKTVFYTALYHTMITPRNISDVDGGYPGGDGKVHHSQKYNRRSIFGGWDVFRSQFPLQSIINPNVVSDMINSLVDLADEWHKDYLARWEFLDAYDESMLGNPAGVIVNDAYQKGIRNYDVQKAYAYAANTTKRLGYGEPGYKIPGNDVSQTLEYSYAAWCVAQLAKSLGKTEDAAFYLKKSQSYHDIFDPEKGWFRPRTPDGSWKAWPKNGRLQQDYGTTESNLIQQGWFVPHDLDGMVNLMGGRDKVIADLNDFFEKTPRTFMWNNYYNHANEPVHNVPFMFNRLGAPWLTQKWTRIICEDAYQNKVEGLVGNDDNGQMSAWYVLASSGIHPFCWGDNRYEISSPLFNQISYGVNGKRFTIIAKNNSPQNTYIQSAKLNGKPYNRSWINYSDIMAGSTLELTMGDKPNEGWGRPL